MKYIQFLFVFLLLIACGGGKKQSLEMEVKQEIALQEETLTNGEIATLEVAEKPEVRHVDPANPPVSLDVSGQFRTKAFDLSHYFSTVKYVKLKHPKASEGTSFFLPQGMVMISNVANLPSPVIFPSVRVKDNWVIVGNMQGLYCYDKAGTYQYTILSAKNPPDATIDLNLADGLLAGFTIVGDICLYASVTKGQASVHFYNLKTRQEEYKRMLVTHQPLLLNPKHKTFIDYDYKLIDDKQSPFMYSLNAKGDTLCRFLNHNMLPVVKGSTYHNPGSSDLYYWKDQLTVRQIGNDTVYRFTSENRICPAYVFYAGAHQATIQDLMQGKQEGKRIPRDLKETDRFLLFSLGSPILYYYDKIEQALYRAGNTEEKGRVLIQNSITEGIPIYLENLTCGDGYIYTLCSEPSLKHLSEDARLSKEQRDKVAALRDEMADGEFLLMYMK